MTDATPDTNDLVAVPEIVLILGDFVHEGVTAKANALGLTLVQKSLRTGPKHWLRVAAGMRELNDARRLAAVFAYLPTPTLLAISDPKYEVALSALVAEMERTSSLAFVYEDNLQGVIEPPPWYFEDEDDEDRRQKVLDSLKRYGVQHDENVEDLLRNRVKTNQLPTRQQWLQENKELTDRAHGLLLKELGAHVELVPFKQRGDVSIRIFEALDDIAGGTFLRVYVPRGRYQEEQLKEVLDLLARYFREVEGREFSIDTSETRRGTTYVFRDRSRQGTIQTLRDGMRRFDEFMVSAHLNPNVAESLLEREGVAKPEAAVIVARYARSYRRLLMDVRHELEQRRLTLSQKMEADLMDARQAPGLASVDEAHPSALFTIVGNSGPVSINMQSKSLHLGPKARAYIENMDSGISPRSIEDQEILGLIRELAGEVESLKLQSDLDRLSDDAVPRDDRSNSLQRLKAFLFRHAKAAGSKLTDAMLQSLITYLEAKLSGMLP